jgi:hypothetical protein
MVLTTVIGVSPLHHVQMTIECGLAILYFPMLKRQLMMHFQPSEDVHMSIVSNISGASIPIHARFFGATSTEVLSIARLPGGGRNFWA